LITDQPLAYFCNATALSILVFSLSLLLLRTKSQPYYWPLAGCLLAIAVLIAQPWLKLLAPSLQQLFLLLSLPALYLLPPCFWLYVQGLTSNQRWQLQRQHLPHFGLSGVAFFIVIAALCLPTSIRDGLLGHGSEQILMSVSPLLRHTIYGLLILTFLMVIGWCVQAGCYLFAVARRLHQYRAQLKQIFASTEQQELGWIVGLLVAVIGVWLLASVSLLVDNLVKPIRLDPNLQSIITLLLVWSLSSWGLRQKPGFAELYQSADEEIVHLNALPSPADGKYQRSALDTELASRIAEKLTKAMTTDQLYLDASLSLPKLAKYIAVSPSYISQTLNEHIGMNFFDYVNHYRVAAAKIQLSSTDTTVLDIAMNVGFNAKSSFYTAFKKETQLTPSQYRQAQATTGELQLLVDKGHTPISAQQNKKR
jgi:AraC-like DNA-binding protein